MNAKINRLVFEWATGPNTHSPTVLIAQLEAMENEALDLIRMRAAEHGLFPAVVASVLMETGLGSEPTPEQRSMIEAERRTQQAQIDQLSEEIRRRMEGGT